MKKISQIRLDYNLDSLKSQDLNTCPIKQFKFWFTNLLETSIADPTAMVLSTYNHDVGVTSRVVLLKDIEDDGFVFYTNYNSMKGKQIASNKRVSLCFFWSHMQRQVRVQGIANMLSAESSISYFSSRPRQSQLAAACSSQSNIIKSRADLEDRFSSLSKKYHKKSIPKPENWGGYKIIPEQIEFWQGRSNRMHDRFRYTKEGSKWLIVRLDP